MRANVNLLWVLAAFFVVADIAYIIWSVLYYNQGLATTPAGSNAQPIEWVGALGIGLSAILVAFIAFYLGRVHAAQGGELPEDRLDANIDDGDPELGHFSPWSWWPIILAGGAAIMFLGVAVGIWIIFIGAGLTLIALVGWTYEYYRGNFAR